LSKPYAKLSTEQLNRVRAYEQTRRVRRREVRAHSVGVRSISKRELHVLRAEYAEELTELAASRPKRRLECVYGPRPCPFVGCKFNLFLDVTVAGSLKLNFPDLEPDEMPPLGSCALDVAEQGGLTLEQLGAALNVTRERARQIEEQLIRKLRSSALAEFEERMGWSPNEVPDVF
jgi:sigma-70-like protein